MTARDAHTRKHKTVTERGGGGGAEKGHQIIYSFLYGLTMAEINGHRTGPRPQMRQESVREEIPWGRKCFVLSASVERLQTRLRYKDTQIQGYADTCIIGYKDNVKSSKVDQSPGSRLAVLHKLF